MFQGHASIYSVHLLCNFTVKFMQNTLITSCACLSLFIYTTHSLIHSFKLKHFIMLILLLCILYIPAFRKTPNSQCTIYFLFSSIKNLSSLWKLFPIVRLSSFPLQDVKLISFPFRFFVIFFVDCLDMVHFIYIILFRLGCMANSLLFVWLPEITRRSSLN